MAAIDTKKENGLKIITHVIVFALLVVLTGKFAFNARPSSYVLFGYGILVTTMTLICFFCAFVLYKDPYVLAQKIPGFKRRRYFVSCLVAVHNEEEVIAQCVESFLAQKYTDREIIFIDDASTDNTLEILKTYAQDKRIRVVHMQKNVGKKKALAAGMARAEGEIFAFSDSDSVLAPDALSKIVAVFNLDPLIGAVSGHCRALNGDKNLLTKIQDSWYEGQFSVRKAFESVFGAVTCVSGPLAVFRREAIYNYIPAWMHDSFLGQEFKFATDRTLTGFVLGAPYIGEKLKKKYADSPFVKDVDYPVREWKIVYCKAAKVWTVVPDTFRRVLKQQIRWKKSFIRNIFFTGTFYWRKPILPALAYYAHILFVLVGPFIVFRHLLYLPSNGNWITAVLYILGIVFVGFCFGLAYKLEDPHSHKWIFRPLMSLLSTLVLSWLIFYSIATIRRMVWSRV